MKIGLIIMFRDILPNFKNWFYYLILHAIETTDFFVGCIILEMDTHRIFHLRKLWHEVNHSHFKSLVIYRQLLFFCFFFLHFILMLPWKLLQSGIGQSTLSSPKKGFFRAPQKRSMPDTFVFRHLMILCHLNNVETRPVIWVRIFRSKWVHELSTQD